MLERIPFYEVQRTFKEASHGIELKEAFSEILHWPSTAYKGTHGLTYFLVKTHTGRASDFFHYIYAQKTDEKNVVGRNMERFPSRQEARWAMDGMEKDILRRAFDFTTYASHDGNTAHRIRIEEVPPLYITEAGHRVNLRNLYERSFIGGRHDSSITTETIVRHILTSYSHVRNSDRWDNIVNNPVPQNVTNRDAYQAQMHCQCDDCNTQRLRAGNAIYRSFMNESVPAETRFETVDAFLRAYPEAEHAEDAREHRRSPDDPDSLSEILRHQIARANRVREEAYGIFELDVPDEGDTAAEPDPFDEFDLDA